MEQTVSLIPEFYFDLIARILPGTYALTCIYYAAYGKIYQPDNLQSSLFTLGVCYAIGLILNFTCDFLLSFFDFVAPKEQSQSRSDTDGNSSGSAERFNPNKAIIKHLTEKVVDRPKAYGILLKMCAELVLLRSLLLTSSLMLIWAAVAYPFQKSPECVARIQPNTLFWSLVGIIFFLILCVLYATCNTQERFLTINPLSAPANPPSAPESTE